MISRDEPMCLNLYRQKDQQLVQSYPLGYATLDGNEYAVLELAAAEKGYYFQIKIMTDECFTYSDIRSELRFMERA